MYAIVRISGRQYRAELGKSIFVEKIAREVGETIDLNDVLLISDGSDTQVGQPTVAGATVTAEITEQFKGKKIIVFKYKPKIRYRRKSGHRQNYTRLKVTNIAGAGHDAPAKQSKPATKKASTKKSVAAQQESES